MVARVGNSPEDAAGACNRASQMLYEHPWGVASHAFPIQFLPCFVGELFSPNGVATTDDLVDQAPVQALAMGCQFALFSGNPPPRGKIAFTVLPDQTQLAFAALFDTAFVVVVVRVVRAALAVQLAL